VQTERSNENSDEMRSQGNGRAERRRAAARADIDDRWLGRVQWLNSQRVGDLTRSRVRDPLTQTFWGTETAPWQAADACRRLEAELLLGFRLDATWAHAPLALLRAENGPVLVYPDSEDPVSPPSSRAPTLEAFLDFAVGAATALARAHERQILHRDIRPANLIRSADGVVKLRSFGRGIALDVRDGVWSELPVEDDALAYAAPEAARRLQPHADQRSDLYSLGVAFYELLTGHLPYSGQTASEWLHAHLAIQPLRPNTFREVPEILDDLVLKLIAKHPDDRYPSAALLLADLLRCQTEWRERETIAPFILAQAGSDRLKLPKQLFGRDPAIQALRNALARVTQSGRSEIVLIAGAAGVGKSALVADLREQVELGPGSFASGKSDQLQRGIPFAPVAQALRSLVERLLSSDGSDLERARTELQAALAGQGKILSDIVPEFELVIGRSPPLAELSGAQALARVNAAILKALAAFAIAGRPLVLFLDDLQWADDSTVALLSSLASSSPPNVLWLGAYRDAEGEPADGVKALRSAAGDDPAAVCEITLEPLSVSQVASLIAQAIDRRESEVAPLADAVHAKTAGNPFFVGQWLRNLVDEGFIRFDAGEGVWVWSLPEVIGHPAADNVIDLMVRRLERIGAGAREILRTIAFIGPSCDEALLARVLDVTPHRLGQQSQALRDAGLLARGKDVYAVSHDRVLEAAYAMAPPAERAAEHARIAAIMIESWRDSRQEAAFAIASQIERADAATLDEPTRLAFATALTAAARRAKAAAAIDQASGYLATARRLLGPDAWAQAYSVAFPCALLSCECLIAQMQLDRASQELDGLLAHAQSPFDQAAAHRLRAILQTLRSRYEEAIVAALTGLGLLGVNLQRRPSSEESERAYRAVTTALNGRLIAELVKLPIAEDVGLEAAMGLLVTLQAAFFVDDGISFVHLAKMVELTLDKGLTPAAPHGLAWFGVFVAHHFGAYEEGFGFAQIALALVERHGWEAARCATLVALDQISAWTQPLPYALARAREAATAGLASGDLGMACYACNHIVSDLLFSGEGLPRILEEAERGLALARRIAFRDIERLIEAQRSLAQGLHSEGYPCGPAAVADDFSELGASTVSQPTLFWEWLYRGMSAVLFDDVARAQRLLTAAGRLTWSLPAHIDLAHYHLYAALAFGAQPGAAERLTPHRDRLAAWAELNPTTFRNKLLLVEAEIARLKGDGLAAMQFYERSTAAAAAAGLWHEEALAHELCGRFCLANGLPTTARWRLRIACDGYRRWGAEAKARHLEVQHGFLAVDPLEPGRRVPRDQSALDLRAWLDAARAFAEEILLDRLIEKLMTSMIVHAGAQYGLLILMRNDQPTVEAIGRVAGREIAVETCGRPASGELIPLTILNRVVATKASVILEDALRDAPASFAAEMKARASRSILCLPLVKQTRLIGALYLENGLAAGVFTPSRTSMLEILASQAAISLDAARLYAELIDENRRRQQTEQTLNVARAELARSSQISVLGGMAASIAHEINQPLTGIAANAAAGARWLNNGETGIGEALANLQAIRNDAKRAADIVQALRSLAKQAPATLRTVNLDEVIGEVLRLASAEIESGQVTLETCLGVGAASVLADPVQIQQVVLNLVTNAVEAMSRIDAPARRLSIRSQANETTVVVQIQDSGEGIAPAALARIFDPFFTTKTSGMGMGLAICRSIVEAHGGALNVTQPDCGGSLFAFELPIALNA
jgi:predicted ATPase/signal transduction histidine kinase